MKHSRRFIKPVLFFLLALVLISPVLACEDYGFPTSTATPAPEETETTPLIINTRDTANLAVHKHLLDQAVTHEAKRYLADFYSVSDNWSAVGDYYKDGSGVWYISVDMSEAEDWEGRPEWQQASWYVQRNGVVTPSRDFNANAIRIEADLQELSLEETED